MAPVAHVEEWVDDCATIAEIEAALVDLRYRHSHGGEPDLRTSVLTHLAWVPPEWQEAAADTLAGLGERHPSRTLLLFPQAGRGGFARSARASRVLRAPRDRAAPLQRGGRAAAPRRQSRGAGEHRRPAAPARPAGLPPLARPPRLRLAGVRAAGGHGRPPRRRLRRVAGCPLRVRGARGAVRPRGGLGHRLATHAALAPRAGQRLARASRPAHGPAGRTTLVAGWLESRAGVQVELERAETLPVGGDRKPSDLLSDELDVFVRDPVYEAATAAAASG